MFRTDPDAAKNRIAVIIVTCIVGTLIGSILAGVALTAASVGLASTGGNGSLAISLENSGFLLMYSPIVSWIGLIVAVPFAVLAIRKGYAGWAVALCAGGFVGLLVMVGMGSQSVSEIRLGGLMGLGLGALFWLSGRIFHPAAFATRNL